MLNAFIFSCTKTTTLCLELDNPEINSQLLPSYSVTMASLSSVSSPDLVVHIQLNVGLEKS